ncbi:hypothetical protein WJX79_000043 [Trebouxia sp. C0005]
MRGQDITVEHQAGQQHATSQTPLLQELPDRPTVRRGPDHRRRLTGSTRSCTDAGQRRTFADKAKEAHVTRMQIMLESATGLNRHLRHRKVEAEQQLMQVEQQIAECQAACMHMQAHNSYMQHVLDTMMPVESNQEQRAASVTNGITSDDGDSDADTEDCVNNTWAQQSS